MLPNLHSTSHLYGQKVRTATPIRDEGITRVAVSPPALAVRMRLQGIQRPAQVEERQQGEEEMQRSQKCALNLQSL